MTSGPQVSLTLNRVKNVLRESGIGVAVFADLVGAPLGSLKASFNGRMYIGAETEASYLTVAARCAAYMKALGPLTFRDWRALKFLLEGDVTPEQVCAAVETVFGASHE